MTTFAEQLRELSVPQLEKLKTILEHIDRFSHCNFDELLESLANPKLALNKSDADLIGARTYELEIYQGLDPATAAAQALEEFKAGKLTEPKPPASLAEPSATRLGPPAYLRPKITRLQALQSRAARLLTRCPTCSQLRSPSTIFIQSFSTTRAKRMKFGDPIRR